MLKYLLFGLTGSIIYTVAVAQSPAPFQIDSLRNLLNKSLKPDSLRAALTVELGAAFMGFNYDSAVYFTQKGLELCKNLKWMRGESSCYRQFGAIYQAKGEPFKAIEYTHQAKSMCIKMGKADWVATTDLNLGTMYIDVGDFRKAINIIDSCIEYFKNNKDNEFELSIAFLNSGLGYLKLDMPDSAEVQLLNALRIAKTSNYQNVTAFAFSNLAQTYLLKSILDSADLYVTYGLNKSKEIGLTDIYAQCLSIKAKIDWEKKNDGDSALAHAQQALDILIPKGVLPNQPALYELLVDIYSARGKWQSALDAYKSLILVRDSITSHDKKIDLARAESKFQYDLKAVALQAKIDRQKIIILSSLAGAALLISTGIFIIRLYKKRKDAQSKQKEAEFNVMLASTELKALRAQMNPHFIFNSLNSIADYIDRQDPQTASLYATRFATLMRMILENSEKKDVCLADDLAALELYMQLEALRLNNRFTYEIDVDEAIDPEETLLPPLLLQPFVENSIWHGIAPKNGEGKVWIRIKKEGEMIRCTIEDNGIGRAKAGSLPADRVGKKSLGMKITQARIDILNKLKNEKAGMQLTDLAQGLRVELRLPFELSF